MIGGEGWLLVGAVAAVGVLHTIVPDHWLPITLIARQQGWTKGEVARAALVAGTGHTVSTLAIALIVWIAGITFAAKFGNLVSIVSSIALLGFGAWTALSAARELRAGAENGHGQLHGHEHDSPVVAGRSSRTTLLLILGSSPMVEGIPAFFAAAKFGPGLLAVMAVVFALSTIATYVSLCVTSVAGLQQISLGPFERYGEVLSGAFIALVGVVFLVFPQI